MSLFSLPKTEFSKAELHVSYAQDAPELALWMDTLAQHINESMPRPELPLDMWRTVFQMKVWRFLLSIRLNICPQGNYSLLVIYTEILFTGDNSQGTKDTK